MESNWRWNVFETGSTTIDIRLVSRISGGPGTGLLLGQSDYLIPDTEMVQVSVSPDYGVVWQPLVFGKGKGFPWGTPVDPDH